jgi:hypothetical protein
VKDKKVQIFVSSTFTDLREERQAAVEAILSSGHIPAGMELFSAGDESQMTVIKRWIDESDIYLLILGGRYGSIESASKKSYTHLEFEYALQTGKPLFSVVISEKALEEKIKVLGLGAIEQNFSAELGKFKKLVLSNLVKFWDDKKDIKIAIHETLADMIYRRQLTGWVRGNKSVDAGLLAEEIARLTKENYDLRAKLSSTDASAVILYSGLSYSQLKILLTSKVVVLESVEINLFDFFLQQANKLSKGLFPSNSNKHIYDKLVLYKLATYNSSTRAMHPYQITEDGHNFYLRALVDNKDSFKKN